MNKILQGLIKDHNVIMIMEFGSQLYGTSTPKSDIDYKGIFLPTKSQILLQEVPKHIKADTKDKHSDQKNTKDDIDIELYSLSYFMDLCIKGETVAIDMLHCSNDKVVYKNGTTWDFIRDNRSKFYTNNLKGFVGYCRKQAAKYGIKGSRIADARRVLLFLQQEHLKNIKSNPDKRMKDVWDELCEGDHNHFVTAKTHSDKEEEFYQVCGKKLQKTARINYCIDMLEKFINSYGHRALLAEKNQGIDWKAMSHALRYGYQIKELFKTGDIKFPLSQRKFLTKVKKGDIYYKKVAMCLEGLMETIEKLSKDIDKTKFPDKTDNKFWRKFLSEVHENIIKGEKDG